MKTTLLFFSVFLSASLFGQNYDKLLQNELNNDRFKASFRNMSNEGVALINSGKNPGAKAGANYVISLLSAACFDYNIRVMNYNKSIDLLDSENILKELSQNISTKARYFFLLEGYEGSLYDSKNNFELVGYFKGLMYSKRSKRDKMNNIMADYVAKKMKEAIQD